MKNVQILGVLLAISVIVYLTTTPYLMEGFPVWLRSISSIDPFAYAVHTLKSLLLKNTGFSGIYSDILILSGFSVVLVDLSVVFFKRRI